MIPFILVGAAYLIGKTMNSKSYVNGGKLPLLAPNGLPSKLTQEQWHLVRTPEFKAWFGDWENNPQNASKVVDEETKEPLVCYHGTDKKINAFRINKKKPYSFWAVNKEYAQQYSKDYINGGREYECFLNIRNPFDSTHYEFTREQTASRLLNLIFKKIDKDKKSNNLSRNKYNYYKNELYNHINMFIKDDIGETQTYLWWLLISDGDSYEDVKKRYKPDYAKRFKNKKPSFLKNLFIEFGYDGIIQYENIHGEEVKNYVLESKKYPYYASKVYVVFKPEQIKLADGTNTTFDGSNPDIKYDEGGEVDYSNFRTSVIGLFNDGKILILQRGSTANWMPNKWSIVGGVVDEGENPKEAIIRECFEEVGLKPINVYFDYNIMTYDSGEIYYYHGDLESDNVQLDYENSNYAFISKSEIDNYDFVPHVKEFIIKLFAKK